MNQLTEENAKAIQKASELGIKALDLSEKAGRYFVQLFGPSLQNLADIGKDRTSLWKLRNFVNVAEKADILIVEHGLQGKIGALEARQAVPLLEAISYETDQDLQEIWATYLVKGITAPDSGFVTKHLTHVLQSLEPDDAKVLSALFSLSNTGASDVVDLELLKFARDAGLSELGATESLDRLAALGIMERERHSGSFVIGTGPGNGAPPAVEFPIRINGSAAIYSSTRMMIQLKSALSI